MKVVDARSGQAMEPGEVVDYGDGEWIRLEKFWSFPAKAEITYCHRDVYHRQKFLTRTEIVFLAVRWFHPSFFFQRVGFIPS